MSTTLSLGGLKKKPAASGKKEYPILPDTDGSIATAVATLCNTKAKIDQLQAIYDLNEGLLKSATKTFAFSGRNPPETVKAVASSGAACSISCQNRYSGIDSEDPRIESLRKIMGDKRFERDMEAVVSITVDLNKFRPEDRQEVVQQLVGIAEMYDNTGGVVAKEQYKPKTTFHLTRCEEYSQSQNEEINKHLPMILSLRAKGVVVS